MGIFDSIGEFLGPVDNLDLFGTQKKGSAERSSAAQTAATELGIEEQRLAREQARSDLAPFREEGEAVLSGLSKLITDPNAKRDFITNNSFFDFLGKDAKSRIARTQGGKAGSKSLDKALKSDLLTMGNDLIGRNINQRFNIAALGANAAGGQATATLGTGRTISDLTTQGGNARAAGAISAQNATTQSRQGAVSAGIGVAAIFASDRRIKTDIKEVGKLDNGLPVYIFRYKGQEKLQMSVMAQDVQEVMPDAVIDIGGILHVNMEKVANGY